MGMNSHVSSAARMYKVSSFLLASLALSMIIPICEYLAFRLVDAQPQLIYDVFTPIYYLASLLIIVSACLYRQKVLNLKIRKSLLVLAVTFIFNFILMYLRDVTPDINQLELYDLIISSFMLLTPIGLLISLHLSKTTYQTPDVLQGRKLISVYCFGMCLITVLAVFEDYVYGYHSDEEIYLSWTNALNIKVLLSVVILLCSNLSGLYGIFLIRKSMRGAVRMD